MSHAMAQPTAYGLDNFFEVGTIYRQQPMRNINVLEFWSEQHTQTQDQL